MTTAIAPGPSWHTDPITQARAALAQPDMPVHRLRQHLAALLAVAEEAQHCPLTGLWTRRVWMREATQAVSDDRPSAALFVDLDDFKSINDTLGHEAGDAILEAVGRRLGVFCRQAAGVAGRLGGDEFVALVPTDSWLYTDRAVLRSELTMPVDYAGHMLRFGASIGTGLVEPGPGHTAAARLSAAMHRADQAMYRDKAARHSGQTTDRRGRRVAQAPASGRATP